VQKFKEPEAKVKRQLIVVLSLKKLSCRNEAARCSVSLKFGCYSRLLKVIRIYTVEQGTYKFLLVFN